MKKIILSLTVLISALGTLAQTQITKVADLNGDRAYNVFTSVRGGWAVNEQGTKFCSTNELGMGLTADLGRIQQAFSFKTNDSKVYLYSIWAEKYVNKDRNLSSTPQDDITLLTQSDGTFVIKFDDSKYINIGGANQMEINDWSTVDAGNKVTINDITETAEYKAALEQRKIQKAREDFYTAIENAKSMIRYDKTPVALSTANVYCNNPEQGEGSVEYLFDNNPNTYYHSSWSDTQDPVHYIQIDMGEDNLIEQFQFNTINRSGATNDYPATYDIEGSNDGSVFTDIAIVHSTAHTSGASFKSNVVGKKGTAYRYIRFNVTDCVGVGVGYRVFFHLAEFALNKAELQDNPLNEKWLQAINEAMAADTPDATVESLIAAKEKLESPDWLTKFNFRYEFKYNGEVKYVQEVPNMLLGMEYPTFNIDFPFGVSASQPTGYVDDEDVVNGVKTVEIPLSLNLPFIPAENYASISNWYLMSLKEVGRYLSYHFLDASMPLPSVDLISSNRMNDYLWAFVGNPFDGFKLYNKAAGTGKILSSSTNTIDGNTGGHTYPIMTSMPVPEGNNEYWMITESSYLPNGFYIEQKGHPNNKMNLRNEKLAYWNGGKDLGSTFSVADPIAYIIDKLNVAYTAKAHYKNFTDAVVGNALGQFYGNKDAILAALAEAERILALSAEEQAEMGAAAICAVVEEINAHEFGINMPTNSSFYRIKGGPNANYYITGNTNAAGERITLTTDATDASTIYYYADNRLYSYESGLSLGISNSHYTFAAIDGSIPTSTIIFAASTDVMGAYTIKSADCYLSYKEDNGVAVLDRSQNADCAYQNWYLEEVTCLPVPVDMEIGYRTIYSPVELSLSNNSVKAYAAKANTEKQILELTELSAIPANAGVVLEYQDGAEIENGCVYLEIQPTTLYNIDTDLVGMFTDIYVTEKSYVLSNQHGVPAFYKAVMDKMTNLAFLNKAFRAYLPSSKLGGATDARFFTFDFGIETAIESVEGEGGNAKAEIYDIAGRRVQGTQKGLYIVNGKKVVK